MLKLPVILFIIKRYAKNNVFNLGYQSIDWILFDGSIGMKWVKPLSANANNLSAVAVELFECV